MSGIHKQPIKTVAFIGAGNMGNPMAKNVQKAGFKLIICERNEKVMDEFSRLGAEVTKEVAPCAAADVVILLLANDAQIMETLTGENGLIQHVKGRHRPIVCMMGTTLPETLNRLQKSLNSVGIKLIDAPISGGIIGAQEGSLTIMMGGDETDVKAVQPLMKSMGKHLFHCGALGAAEVVKIINNMIGIANMYLTAEAVELAGKYGVSFERLSDVVSVSTGMNYLNSNPTMGRAQFAAWARSPDAYTAIYNVLNKDLHLALKLADFVNLAPGLLKLISKYVELNDPDVMARWVHIGESDVSK